MDVVERLTLAAVQAHSLIAVEHLHRYELAAELCSGLRVADVGCGSGYGSRLLRENSPAVTAIDDDAATIEVAQATVGRDADIRFEVADAHDFLARNLTDEFDAIVMFGTLEHLSRPEDALASIRRHANRGLRAVISLPNSEWFDEDNLKRRTDFGFDEAIEAFQGFEDCTVLYQFLAEGSLIRPSEATETCGRVVATERGELEYANHFIACVNLSGSLERLPDWARMHLEAAPLASRHMRNLEQANRELRRTNARLGRRWLGKADSAAASLLARLELERGELEARLAKVDPRDPEAAARTEREALLNRIEELHEQVRAHDRQLREITSTRAWRLVTRYWGMRDALKNALSLGRGR